MKEITFYPESKFVKDIIPSPRKIEVPDWFKKIKPYHPVPGVDENTFTMTPNGPNTTVKLCIPFLDSLTNGYCFYTWTDILVKQTPEGTSIMSANIKQELTEVVINADPGLPALNGFDKFILSWRSHWGIKTPKGYSCIFTHPFNRTDLPFITTTGIVDTDKWGVWGDQPFALQTGWEGIIPAGTPMIHVFPFKRDDWKHKIDDSLTEWGNTENIKITSKLSGYYKNNFWQKKLFD
jgi:hypothetical protein